MIALAPIEIFHPKTPIEFLAYLIALVIVPFLLIGFTLHKKQALHDLLTEGLFLLTGRMGSGKSYFMTTIISYALDHERLVFANYDIVDAITWHDWTLLDHANCSHLTAPCQHRGVVLVSNWTEARTAPWQCVIVIDEAQNWWGAQDWNAPIEQREWITRLRKLHVTLIASAQDLDFLARWLRKLAYGVWEGSRFRTGHLYRLFPVAVAGKNTKNRKPELQIVLKRSKKIMAMYDTRELVKSSREWGGTDEPETARVAPPRPTGDYLSPF